MTDRERASSTPLARLLSDHDTSVDEDDLAAVEQEAGTRWAAESLDRRQADQQLVERLAGASFSGSEFDKFKLELAAYGVAVIKAWLLTGEMFRQCRRRGYGIGPRPSDWSDEDVSSLTHDTVVDGIEYFCEQGLIGERWQAERGASLKTYLIGACVLTFPNIYRRWQREQQRLSRAQPVEPTDIEFYVPGTAVPMLRTRSSAALKKAHCWQVLVMNIRAFCCCPSSGTAM